MGNTTHIHNITDTDHPFTIDPITRELKNESKKTTLMQYDHNSERFRFSISDMVEGHDMSKCDSVQIHYYVTEASSKQKQYGMSEILPTEGKNQNGEIETSILHANFDESGNYTGKLEFTWLITENITYYAGSLSFSIRFCCSENTTITDEEGKIIGDTSDVIYRWSTAANTSVIISPVIDGDTEIVDSYPDVLTTMQNKLDSVYNNFDAIVEQHTKGLEEELREYANSLDQTEFATTDEITAIFSTT
jgi:hypothetical protein